MAPASRWTPHKHYIILPDSLGAGKSSKPSDGLRTKFPKYSYGDMVQAQYRLVSEGLGIPHLRLVLGNSMGGSQAWIWATQYPDFMDAVVPMASQPTAMGSRNWMMRRLIIDAIRNDPAWKNGDYTEQPPAVRIASVFFDIATNNGSMALAKNAPTRLEADKFLDERLARPFTADANDLLYLWDSSRDYDPSPGLENIRAAVLAINSADDERYPAETGIRRACPQARQKRPLLSDTGLHRNAWPRHNRHGKVLEAARRGLAGNGSAAGNRERLIFRANIHQPVRAFQSINSVHSV